MWRFIILAGSIMVTATQMPVLVEKVMAARENSQQVAVEKSSRPRKPSQAKSVSYSGRKVRIKSGYGGHFITDVRMNNRSVKVLVDTGATTVAINETTARKIGIHLRPADFKYKVSTANGIARMASATISEIRIGNIRVKNVRAGVLKDSALSSTLLGMSFLNKLRRFEVHDGTLLLEQ